MYRVFVTPQGIAVRVSSRNADTQVQQSKTSKIAGKLKILEESPDFDEASFDGVLEPGVVPVGGMVILVTTSGEDVAGQRDEEDDLSPVQQTQEFLKYVDSLSFPAITKSPST